MDLDSIRDSIDAVMRPAHFFAQGIGLEWQHQPAEIIRWEVFQGRLLDPAHTRAQCTFESWQLWQLDAAGRSGEPLLSVKLDAAAKQVHVVRAILTHGWEAFDSGGNVIDSRPALKWVRELVGSIDLAEFADAPAVLDELAILLHQAVVGISRLALTSIEAPLPAFSLGQLLYVYQPQAADQGPMRSSQELLERGLPAAQSLPARAKVLETLLRTADVLPRRGAIAAVYATSLHDLLLEVFNNVSLSPYTNFVPRALAFARSELTAEEHSDFLATLLRRLCRHLTAFDLVLFHHRGANYPDALLLDAALRQFASLIEERPDLAHGRLARRALRQAWLLRRHYEGHQVPDLPTSEGENARVLPPPFQRVPEEQITDPSRRQRQLFAGAPLELGPHAQHMLAQSLADLDEAAELQELGTALYLDRPLGIFKRPGEPDRTPLLSYVAFSRSLAERRLGEFHQYGVITAERLASLRDRLAALDVPGIPLEPHAIRTRPGAASLADACQVAGDFRLLRTTPRSAADFLALLNLWDHDFQQPNHPLLIVSGAVLKDGRPEEVTIFAADLRPRLVLAFDPAAGMRCRSGREFPRGGLHSHGLK